MTIFSDIYNSGVKDLNSKNFEKLKKVELYHINENIEEPNINKISKTLRALIILYINKNDNYRINPIDENYQKNILLNKKWLDYYKKEYEEIKTLLKDKEFNIKDLNLILSKIDDEKLIEIDNKIKNKEKIKISIAPLLEKMKLNNNKTIEIINKDLFIVNQRVYNEVTSYLEEKNKEEILYSYNNNISCDIILIEKNPQFTLLVGEIDDKNNIYNIKYIFDFSSDKSYKEEKNKILKTDNLDNYMKEKTIFNEELKNIYISPIFKKGDIIGYCYKYFEAFDYSSCMNYYELLSNGKLSNSIDIYFNYQRISAKVKKKEDNPKYEKYYIINKELLTEIKIYNEFKTIYDIMVSFNIQENELEWKQKLLLSILNTLPDEELKKYTKNEKNEYKQNFEPNIIPVQNLKESIFIYDKFEIIQKEIIEKLYNKEKILNNYYLDCIINDNKILINYPENPNGKKYVTVIGSLEEYDKSFITEYILIFDKKEEQKKLINNIKGKINIYLNSLEFNNNIYCIEENSIKLGIIYKNFSNNTEIESNQIANDNNNTNIIDNENNSNNNKANNETNINYNENNQINDNNKSIPSSLTVIGKKSKKNKELIDEYNLDSIIPEFKTILMNFKKPPKIGLQNIGATCYMNSTLQCFCHIIDFVNYFKYNSYVIDFIRKDKEKKTLTSSFRLLIENLWPNNHITTNKYYSPNEFKAKISKLNPLFEGIAANDAKDLVNFIIMTLHLELNQNNNKGNNNQNNTINKNLNQSDQNLMYTNFKNEIEEANKSIIKDLFYGINCNSTQCSQCQGKIYNYQIYFFLTFPLEEVRKYRDNKFNNMNNNNMMMSSGVNVNNNMNVNNNNMIMSSGINLNNNMMMNNDANLNNSNMNMNNMMMSSGVNINNNMNNNMMVNNDPNLNNNMNMNVNNNNMMMSSGINLNNNMMMNNDPNLNNNMNMNNMMMSSGANLNNNMNMNNNNMMISSGINSNNNINNNNMMMNNDPSLNNNMNVNNNNMMMNNEPNLNNNMNINMNSNNMMANNSCNNNMNNFFNMNSINTMNNNLNSVNNFNQNSGICLNNNINNTYNNNNLNMKTFNIINNYVGTNTVRLIDCFEYDQKINHMSGENQMYCNYCRKNTDCYMQTILTEGPEVLILLLNRGKGIEFDIKIQFGESIDLSKFFTNEQNCIYDLIGVITHFGESSMSGHFIAYCRDPLNIKNWIKYNDSIVTDVDSNNFQKEVIDFGMPYLLFYQKSK